MTTLRWMLERGEREGREGENEWGIILQGWNVIAYDRFVLFDYLWCVILGSRIREWGSQASARKRFSTIPVKILWTSFWETLIHPCSLTCVTDFSIFLQHHFVKVTDSGFIPDQLSVNDNDVVWWRWTNTNSINKIAHVSTFSYYYLTFFRSLNSANLWNKEIWILKHSISPRSRHWKKSFFVPSNPRQELSCISSNDVDRFNSRGRLVGL